MRAISLKAPIGYLPQFQRPNWTDNALSRLSNANIWLEDGIYNVGVLPENG